jgi:hypothetical protein
VALTKGALQVSVAPTMLVPVIVALAVSAGGPTNASVWLLPAEI